MSERTNFFEFGFYTDLLQPYVRMTQRSMFVNKYAKLYLSSKANLKELMAYELKDREKFKSVKKMKIGSLEAYAESYYAIPPKTIFRMGAQIIYPVGKLKRKQDVDNLLKAILDAGNELIYEDDRWCDNAYVNRFEHGSRDRIHVWLWFEW